MTENFFTRWSRLKASLPEAPPASGAPAGSVPVAATPKANLPPLPELDTLEFASDFTPFMQTEVDDSLRKAALQRLFHDDHFNVMDGLDVYIDDYNTFEAVGAEMLRNLNQARGLLFADEPSPAQDAGETEVAAAARPDADEAAPPAPATPADGEQAAR